MVSSKKISGNEGRTHIGWLRQAVTSSVVYAMGLKHAILFTCLYVLTSPHRCMPVPAYHLNKVQESGIEPERNYMMSLTSMSHHNHDYRSVTNIACSCVVDYQPNRFHRISSTLECNDLVSRTTCHSDNSCGCVIILRRMRLSVHTSWWLPSVCKYSIMWYHACQASSWSLFITSCKNTMATINQ